MLASYKRVELSDETAALWAESVSKFEVEDGLEAVHILGESSTFMPALAEILDTIRECRNDRLTRDRVAALPSTGQGGRYTFSRFLSENPEARARIEALQSRPRHPALEPGSAGESGIAAILRGELGKR
jgi:hypothetical protein